ncbi:glycoside hydrolase family 92 protein [Xylariaceae sp. FL0255]|nr:glycoside hydrolase family 92 protein [Xylariaceae sp. FL0255]
MFRPFQVSFRSALFAALAASSSAPSLTGSKNDILNLVNPLIGSANGGNVFVGASKPYGMAKAVADSSIDNTGGFADEGNPVQGFSMMHDSGTGGNPSLGNFPLFPQLCPDDVVDNCNFRIGDRATGYINSSVDAVPGRFSIELESGVKAAMTTSEHAAVFQFEFPAAKGNGSKYPLVLLDLTDMWQSRQNATISVSGTGTARMMGNGNFLPSFGAGSYVMYFCADFFGGKVRDSGIWVNNRAGTEPKELYVTRGFNLFYLEAGGWAQFEDLEDNTLTARVGTSFISAEQACTNAETEIPNPAEDFDELVTEAQSEWREKLQTISISPGGASVDMQTSFYTSVYHTMMSPQNYTGENPKWDSGIPYFDSFYCIWDSFRVQHPLLTIIDPLTQTQLVNSLIDIYEHEGWLPDCHMSLCNGWTQGGSNADIVLVDAYVKNLTGINWEKALEAIIQDAEVEPLEWSFHGRGGLASWKTLDYIPYLDFDPAGFGTNSRSISRTLEYGYNDYCLATLAQGLGHSDLYTKYAARSGNWQNLWKADQTSLINGTNTGFTGFFQPKYQNGTWGFQDPIDCSSLAGFCSLTTNPSETFEASIWQYQFLVPQSQASLISLMGGDDKFVDRLDFFHTSGLADISNEPAFLTVYLYHYAGRPGLSTKRLHTYIPSDFNDTESGLPGNDDSGAMGAFVTFGMIGLYPLAGQDVYLISAPFFEAVNITSPLTGKIARITTTGFDAAYENVFIQNVTVNGKPWTKSWITHDLFTEGWSIEIALGAKESNWGTAAKDRPPSFTPLMTKDSADLGVWISG